MKDTNGREYAQLSKIFAGSKVQVDGGFDCMIQNTVLDVHKDEDGFWVECKCGRHYLEGQLHEDTDYLVGVYMA